MVRCSLALLALALTTHSLGCALCSAPDDKMYSAYGGSWQRDDMCCGRVGSVFAPAGAKIVDAADVEFDAAEPLPEPEEIPGLPPEADSSPMEPMDPAGPGGVEPMPFQPGVPGDPRLTDPVPGGEPAVPGGIPPAADMTGPASIAPVPEGRPVESRLKTSSLPSLDSPRSTVRN